MPATSWTEQTLTDSGWQEGIPFIGDASTDYFIDVLFEGTTLFGILNDWTEQTLTAASWTEKSQSQTSWTEASG